MYTDVVFIRAVQKRREFFPRKFCLLLSPGGVQTPLTPNPLHEWPASDGHLIIKLYQIHLDTISSRLEHSDVRPFTRVRVYVCVCVCGQQTSQAGGKFKTWTWFIWYRSASGADKWRYYLSSGCERLMLLGFTLWYRQEYTNVIFSMLSKVRDQDTHIVKNPRVEPRSKMLSWITE